MHEYQNGRYLETTKTVKDIARRGLKETDSGGVYYRYDIAYSESLRKLERFVNHNGWRLKPWVDPRYELLPGEADLVKFIRSIHGEY